MGRQNHEVFAPERAPIAIVGYVCPRQREQREFTLARLSYVKLLAVREKQWEGRHGMLYDNQISSVFRSPPNQGLTNIATPVLAPHPNKMMTVVNEG